MEAEIRFPRYDSYKDSGADWLGEIPAHWDFKRLGTVFKERKTKVSDKDFRPLSVTKNGILPQLNTAAKSDDGDNRKGVRKGDFVINSRSDRKGSSGIAHEDGSVSLINIVLKPNGIDPRYCEHLLKSNGFIEEFYRHGHGIVADLWTTKYWDMKSIQIPLPDLPTQQRIANFLDKKTAEIDKAIAKKQRLIELLKEQEAILINQAVTRGLNPDAPMRDSGVKWIGEIPAHWDIKRAKYLFREVDERTQTGKEELLSVSHMTGVTLRSEKNVYMFMAEDYTGSKLCRKDDLVFNIMWAWMGALGVSDRTGIVSPSYGVYRQLVQGTFNAWFLENLLRSEQYVAEYNRRSTGLNSSRLRLYAQMFFAMELGFPSIKEQNLIEQKVSGKTKMIDKALLLVTAEIEKLQELRDILIANAVTGKIKI